MDLKLVLVKHFLNKLHNFYNTALNLNKSILKYKFLFLKKLINKFTYYI